MDIVRRPPTGSSQSTAAGHPGPVQRLEAELMLAEQRLNDALASATAANTALRASNTEQQSLNEELRAANEELAASEAESQALNVQLSLRVDDLARANSDMQSVIESTRIAIIFLDMALCIRSLTPAVQQVIHVREGDQGRSITDLVQQIDYPDLAMDARRVLRTHETVERHARHKHRDAHYLVRLLPHRGSGGAVAGVVVTYFDVSATVQAEQALRTSEERFRRMAAAVPALLFMATPDLGWDYVNPPFYALTGLAEGAALDTGWQAALHPEDLELTHELWRLAAAAASPFEQEARLRRADASWCWFLIRAMPQLDAAGGVIRWYGSCTDIDERRHVGARQGKLLAELQHRIKNILAVVRSVLTRTLESSSDLEHFAAHLAGRIEALARTQCVSARTTEGSVMLDELVYQELAAHGGQDERQILVEGPPVSLSAKIADSLGLAIHELATNSIKYGALASSAGRVRVRWNMEPDGTGASRGRLVLEWKESGVPLMDLSPGRRGFGRELIEQGLPYELGATTSFSFGPGGLACTVALDLPHPARLDGPEHRLAISR